MKRAQQDTSREGHMRSQHQRAPNVLQDMARGTTYAPATPVKALQDMSKEELVQKCKALLALAHKAKAAKDGMCFLDFFSPHNFWTSI